MILKTLNKLWKYDFKEDAIFKISSDFKNTTALEEVLVHLRKNVNVEVKWNHDDFVNEWLEIKITK